MTKICIIGAGFGGLSAACMLAKEGFDVTVVEKNEQSGGRARLLNKDGFVFDMGPSWYMMPKIFDHFFDKLGKKQKDYYDLQQLDPAYQVIFDKDKHFNIVKDIKKNFALFDRLEKGGADKLKKYLQDFMSDDFMIKETSFNFFDTFDNYVRSQFKSEEIIKMLEFMVVFLGGAPKNIPAMYSVISHIDFHMGIWYPKGGMGAVAKGMEKLARELGVTFVFNTPVTKIHIDDGIAKSVSTPKGKVEADLIIVNADYHHAQTQLLDKEHRSYEESYWQEKTIAPSGVMMYLGVDKKLPKLEHHNLFFDGDWDGHFSTVSTGDSWPEDPLFYLCVPSRTDSTVAPQGKENLFVLIPAAAGLENTELIMDRYFDHIMHRLEQFTGTSIKNHVVSKTMIAQKEFKTLYNAYKGTAFGLAHTLEQTAQRPSNQSDKVSNLYFTGQYTQPGIGVPMVILSSEIIANEIISTWTP